MKFVGPDHPTVGCMPEGSPWIIVRTAQQTTLFFHESAQGLTAEDKERHLEAAWRGYRALAGHTDE